MLTRRDSPWSKDEWGRAKSTSSATFSMRDVWLAQPADEGSVTRVPRAGRARSASSGHCFLDEYANLVFCCCVQRSEGPGDRVHVGALLACRVHGFTEAEGDEVLV